MDALTGWETTERVLATAREAGFNPSEKQRKDWRRAGLLPEAVNPHGRGRGKGTALYPAGTGEMLTAICRHSKPKKRAEDLAFLTWWDGFPVEANLILEKLHECLHDLEGWLQSGTAGHSEQIARVATAGRLPEPLRTIRRRIGPRRFQAMHAVLSEVASGDFKEWGLPDNRDAVLTGLGLDRARRDRSGVIEPWLRGFLHEQLHHLAGSIQLSKLQGGLETTIADDDLDRARDELQVLLGYLYTAKLSLETTAGPGSFGLGLVPDPRDLDHKIAPGLLLVWLAWRQLPQLHEGYTTLMRFAETGAPLGFFRDLMRSGDTGKPRQRLQPLRGTAHGEESSRCSTSLSP